MTKLHSILISDRPVTASPWIQASLNSLAATHPGMALTVHSDEALRAFIADVFDRDVLSAYDRCDSVSKSCLGRYCLLFEHGGLYSDPNIFFVAPVVQSPDSRLHAFHNIDSSAPSVSVSLIATPAKMDLFERCISKFVELARKPDGDLRAQGSGFFGETIAYCGSRARPVISWGDELRLPSRAGVIRYGYKSTDGAFVAVRQMQKPWATTLRADHDMPGMGDGDAEDIAALLSMLDGWI